MLGGANPSLAATTTGRQCEGRAPEQASGAHGRNRIAQMMGRTRRWTERGRDNHCKNSSRPFSASLLVQKARRRRQTVSALPLDAAAHANNCANDGGAKCESEYNVN